MWPFRKRAEPLPTKDPPGASSVPCAPPLALVPSIEVTDAAPVLIPEADSRVTREARAAATRSAGLRAVREFIELLQMEAGEADAWFKTPDPSDGIDWKRAALKPAMGIVEQYAQLAAEFGWPKLADKTLSLHLQAWGCTVIEVNLRPYGGGRPRRVAWPDVFDELDLVLAA